MVSLYSFKIVEFIPLVTTILSTCVVLLLISMGLREKGKSSERGSGTSEEVGQNNSRTGSYVSESRMEQEGESFEKGNDASEGIGGDECRLLRGAYHHKKELFFSITNEINIYKDDLEEIIEYFRTQARRNLIFALVVGVLGIMLGAGFVVAIPDVVITQSSGMPQAPRGVGVYNDFLHLLTRVSPILFTEILAFSLLKMHKDCLEKVVFYQNELTNLLQKYTALMVAVGMKKKFPRALHKILEDFSETERNFILKKGETTVEIKKSEINDKFFQKLNRLFSIKK